MSSTDPTSPSRCCVLVPVGNSIEPECERGLLVLELLGYQVRRVRGFSQIDVARNSIASSAIQDGFEETFWIDSDIGFSPDDILRIRQRNIPLCCGIYPKKGLRELACHVIPGTAEIRFGEKDGGLVEVLYAGAGFLHVRAEVYHAIERQCGLRICDARFGTPNLPYFQPLIKQTSSGDWYLGEDYAFSERARVCGYRIMADTRVRLRHFGKYGYSWEDMGSELPRFAEYQLNLE